MATGEPHPRLRPLDIRAVQHEGRSFLLLRDPLELSDQAVLVPEEVGPVLAFCDGTHDLDSLSSAVAVRFGLRIRPDLLRQLVDALDTALLLENERYRQARAAAVAEFRSAPCRPPGLAGASYPSDPGELRALLDGYASDAPVAADPEPVRGLISPHIDYERGGSVYARVWMRAAEAACAADVALILGTDHSGGEGDVTLTRQSYATPFGILPTPGGMVDAIADAMGEDAVFAGELFHRDEHSIELAAVWLHYVRGGRPCEMLPVLCGPMSRFIEGENTAQGDPGLARFAEAVAKSTRGRRVLVVAAADLAHVGPEFGGQPLTSAGKVRLRAADDDLTQRICAGDAEAFLDAISEAGNVNNVCGVSPIYLALRLLQGTTGERVSYALCPADDQGTSVVSVCGVLLR